MSSAIKTQIQQYIAQQKGVASSQLVKKFGLSRQMIARHLRDLLLAGKITKTGSTRNALYYSAKNQQPPIATSLTLNKKTAGLEEDRVFTEIDLRLGLKKSLSKMAYDIAYYAFTEMLNNAIDHSSAPEVEVKVCCDLVDFSFEIIDRGIGLFAHARKVFQLNDDFEALEHIIKGKQTTQPEAHSGQGIFFTSRIADEFEIKSQKIKYSVNNLTDDTRAAEIPLHKGTSIHFKIKLKSRKKINDLFRQYSDDEYEFDKSDVIVKLNPKQKLVARSQAKRLLAGLEQFKIVTLDFKNVEEIGQGYVDEIFHVFKGRYPNTQIIYRNTNPAVEFMIQRAQKKAQ